MTAGLATIRRVPSESLQPAEVASIRELLLAAFEDDEEGGFAESDWQHARGGVHVVLAADEGEADGILAHAAVVERTLEVDGKPFRTGYVEAVATRPGYHRRGHGSAVMREVNQIIHEGFELGALGTGRLAFYERLGWELWRGPSSVRSVDGLVPTPDEDGAIMVLRTPSSRDISVGAPISCDWRSGDVW